MSLKKLNEMLDKSLAKEDYEFYGIKCSLGEVTHRIPAKELQDKGSGHNGRESWWYKLEG